MKRNRDIIYSSITDNNNILYVLKNLDIKSLIKLSLINKLFRLFSLSFIRDHIKLNNNNNITYNHFLTFKNLDNMINRCYFNQKFAIIYQQLYITKEEEIKFPEEYDNVYKEGEENNICLLNVI